MGKNRSLLMFILAIGLGLGAAWMANGWLTARLSPAEAETNPDWDSVVAAALEIKFGQAIEEAHVRVVQVPKGGAPAGAFTAIEDVKGKVATQSILPGEFIVAGRLTNKHGGSTLAAVVPEGKRAVTVRVNDVVGVAGFLLPGNRVDVIATRKVNKISTSKTLLENIKVLAVDQTASSDKNDPVIVRAITLELTPRESERLVKATSEGSVQMALRNPLDDHKVASIEPPKEIVKEVVKVVEKPIVRRPSYYSVTVIKGTNVGATQVR